MKTVKSYNQFVSWPWSLKTEPILLTHIPTLRVSEQPLLSRPPPSAEPMAPQSLSTFDLGDEQVLRPISPTTANPPGFPLPPRQKSEKKGGLFSRTIGTVVPKFRTITVPPEVKGYFVLQLPQCMKSPFPAIPSRANPQPYWFNHNGVTHMHHIRLVNSSLLDRAPPESVGRTKTQIIRMRRESSTMDQEAIQNLQKFSFSKDAVNDDQSSTFTSSMIGSSVLPRSPIRTNTELTLDEEIERSGAEQRARDRERELFLTTVANLSQGGSIKKGKPWIELGDDCGHLVQIVYVEKTEKLCSRCRDELKKIKTRVWNSHVERQILKDNDETDMESVKMPKFRYPEDETLKTAGTAKLSTDTTGESAATTSGSPSTVTTATEIGTPASEPGPRKQEMTWLANGAYEKKPKLIFSQGSWKVQ